MKKTFTYLLFLIFLFSAGQLFAQAPDIIVSGTNSTVDGTYQVFFVFNGKPAYSIITNFDEHYIRWYGTEWRIGNANSGSTYYTNPNDTPLPPAAGWVMGPDGTSSLPTISGGVSPLPVELIDFTVNIFDLQVLVKWATASEINNSGFDVQRSHDGKNWQDLTFTPGHGTTLEEKSYTYTDKRPLPGLNYYRLRQVDYDGQRLPGGGRGGPGALVGTAGGGVKFWGYYSVTGVGIPPST